MLRAELTVEPFVVGARGPHVEAAVAAAGSTGLAVEDGPFGIAVEGDDDAVLSAASAVLSEAMRAGATRVSLQLTRVDT
jgi:uncharacterized protein YqgV (UPF0045/DUF77 family)